MTNHQTKSLPSIDFSKLLRAVEGLTQWRPMVLGFLSLVFAGLLMTGGQFLALQMGGAVGALLALLLGLAAVLMVASGFSGAGVMLMDRARSLEPRSMVNALVFGLMCLPKFIGFALLLLVLTLALSLAAALVYFVCKVPGVGPLLLFVAHPVLVVAAAVFFTAITWVAIPLFMPAVWDGRPFKEAISVVFAVARTRLAQVVALFLGLYLVIFFVGLLLFAALLPGYGFMTGLASVIVEPRMLGGGMPSLMGLAMGGSQGSGHMYAGLLATGLIFAVVTTLMTQVLIMGVNLVYLSATESLDISASQNALQAGLAQARNKAREAQERARMAAERTRGSVRSAAAAAGVGMASAVAAPAPEQEAGHESADPVAAAPACPQCHQGIAADDVFCGHCGHRLG